CLSRRQASASLSSIRWVDIVMNSANGIDIPASPAGELALTPEALAETLRVNAPSGPVTVKGMATDVKYWSRNGDDKVLKIYGRLVLGDASIRFELQPHAAVRNDAPVVLHGSLRIKKSETFRTTHEVILVGDVVGSWVPYEPVPLVSPAPLVRQQPRVSLEAALAKHGLEAIAILATGTAWNDLAAAAQSLPVFSHCRRVETNFMEPEQFLSDLAKVCQDPAIQVLVIARGGGDSLEVIGDSREVACALLACGRPFYTALGHDDNVMLLDKHADRSFSTPSILGQALMETARDITQRQELQESLGKFAQENASLKEQLLQANARLEQNLAKEPSAIHEADSQKGIVAQVPVPAPTPEMRRYVIWAIALLVVFAIGRCST
ncbi:TPA: exodeoxyribonuclease VII large subunit, partial [Pseudomonas aeruginosa]